MPQPYSTLLKLKLTISLNLSQPLAVGTHKTVPPHNLDLLRYFSASLSKLSLFSYISLYEGGLQSGYNFLRIFSKFLRLGVLGVLSRTTVGAVGAFHFLRSSIKSSTSNQVHQNKQLRASSKKQPLNHFNSDGGHGCYNDALSQGRSIGLGKTILRLGVFVISEPLGRENNQKTKYGLNNID